MARMQQVWLVTGCSSGFGEAFIKSILQRGDKAIATARRLESIKHLVKLGAATLQLDVTDSQLALNEKIKQAWAIYNRIDVLVQNAGYGFYGAVEDVSAGNLEKNYQTNVFGVANLTRSITSYFRQQQSGFIVLVSSAASQVAFSGFSSYCSSKAAIEMFMQIYAHEVRPIGIRTLIVQPGSFRTSIRDLTRKADNFVTNSTHYQEILEGYKKTCEDTHGTQRGDPEKFANLTIDLVKGEGTAEGKEVPLILPVGPDSVPVVKARLTKQIKVIEEWENVLVSTDFDGQQTVISTSDLNGSIRFGD